MPVEHLSVLPAILGVEDDGAAANHNGHDDNARRDDGDDDDSRSRSHSPRDRRRCTTVTDAQVVERIVAVVVAHMQDAYTARLEDRLYVDLQLFLYLHSSHISHIYNISTLCR